MTKLEQALHGYVWIEIQSAAPEFCLNRLADSDLPFWDVTPVDAFSFRICAFYRDRKRIQRTVEHSQAESRIVSSSPGIWFFLTWLKRPCLLLAFALALFAVFVLPNYIWTISVSGNETIPTSEILRALDDLGVRFGTKNDAFKSQDIKNRLLNAVDGLQWAAVNCSGGHCEVLVKERVAQPTLLDRHQITDVLAARTGTIVEMRVLAGQALCRVGDTVEAGQTLVSGTTDWVIDLQTSHAQAEIYALTWHNLETVTPTKCYQSGEAEKESVCRYLQLGRFRIKLSGSSRICDTGCDKMVTREILTLPGGYTFPVTLITETCITSEQTERPVSKQEAAAILQDYGTRAVGASMIAGQILSCEKQMQKASGRYFLEATYACREMIAQEQEVNLFGSEQINGRTYLERGAD